MILRSLTKHIKEQNWFAVLLDFLIVVVGILMAFQITNWSEQRTATAQLEQAEVGLQQDLLTNYFNAKERTTFTQCRKEQVSQLSKKLLEPGDEWQSVAFNDDNTSLRAIPIVLRSASRNWGSREWDAEVSRGTFSLMDNDRRKQLERLFVETKDASVLQEHILTLQARVNVLSQNLTLSRSERLHYLELLAEIDEKSVSLERISALIAEAIEAIGVLIKESAKGEIQEYVARTNKGRLAVYGDCVNPIIIPFFN